MRTVKTIERFEDTMIETSIEIEIRSAVVDYRDILENCEIVSDDDMGPPWTDDEGWDHETDRVKHDGQRESRAYTYEAEKIITPTDSSFLDSYDSYRRLGCSKQVSAEMTALAKRGRLNQLVKWYDQGYSWYGVKGEHLGRKSSCWGIDDYDYANDYTRHEIAGEIADELEDDGYTITNRPDPIRQHRQAKRDRLKRNLTLDCWID